MSLLQIHGLAHVPLSLFTGFVPVLIIYAMLAWAMPKPYEFNLDDFREQ